MKNRLFLFILITVILIGCCSCKKSSGSLDEAPTGVIDKEQDESAEKPDQEISKDEPEDKPEENPEDKTEEKPEDEPEEKPEAEDGECVHEFGEWISERKATCVWEGISKRVCSKCGYKETKNLPKTAHTEVVIPAVPSTCAVFGKTEGKQCSYCHSVTVPQEDTPKKEHVFKNGYSCECGDFVESAKFLVLSQNVRCADDGENKMISDRAPRFKQLVEKYKPDIIGTQETTPRWNTFFEENLTEYGRIGCSREGENATVGEWGTILYRLDRFELIDSDTFWLSDTPEKVSRVKGSKCNRICTWALFKDKSTQETFVMANTHLDHGTDEVREQQMEILLNELSDLINRYPLILTGDFNAIPGSAAYNAATEKLVDARTDALENRSTIEHTFDSYGQKTSGKIIDYCFYTDKATATWYKVANDQFDGYVSDHYGVLSQFGIK